MSPQHSSEQEEGSNCLPGLTTKERHYSFGNSGLPSNVLRALAWASSPVPGLIWRLGARTYGEAGAYP